MTRNDQIKDKVCLFNARDSTTIPVQIQVIAIVIPPVFVTDTQLPHKKYEEAS